MSGRRRRALKGLGKSPLFQFWTSIRFRIFLRGAASKLKVTQSALVRVAVWEHIQRNLSPAERRKLSALATEYEQNTAAPPLERTPRKRNERDGKERPT